MEPSGASKGLRGPERSFLGSHGLLIAFVRGAPFMPPPPWLFLKEPRAFETSVFYGFYFVGLGRPRKTREGKGNHIIGIFLLSLIFVFFLWA